MDVFDVRRGAQVQYAATFKSEDLLKIIHSVLWSLFEHFGNWQAKSIKNASFKKGAMLDDSIDSNVNMNRNDFPFCFFELALTLEKCNE